MRLRDRGRGSVLGPGEDQLVLEGGDGHCHLSGHTETDRMDFLRLHLPGLHQALRGALDSLSTFVSYLMGDEVPTVDREAPAAEELKEVAAGRPGKIVEEEAQEALEGLPGSQGEGVGEPSQPGEAERCQRGSSAAEQTLGWGEGSSLGGQADSQDTGAWEAAKARGQEPSAPAEAAKKCAVGSGAQQDRLSQAQERQGQELGEQEVNKGETKRTWEREEEEEVRAPEPGLAGGAESEWTWHGEPERKAGVQKVAGNGGQTEQVVKEAVAETEEPGARGDGKEEQVIVSTVGQSIRALDTQGAGAEFEHWTTLSEEEACTASSREEASLTSSGREEAWTASGREEARTTSDGEEADLPGVREAEYGPVPGERIQEATSRVWVLEEASRGEQEEEVSETREAEAKLFPRQTQGLDTEGSGEAAVSQTVGQESEEEAREGSEGEAGQHGKEAEGRQDLEIRASLELEEVQGEEAQEEKGPCWAIETELAPDKETQSHANVEVAPEARPEEDFICGKSEEAPWSQEALGVNWVTEGQETLKHKITGGLEAELMGGTLTSVEPPEEGWGSQEEPQKAPGLRMEDTERRLEEHPRHKGSTDTEVSEDEAWENQRRDRESRNSQEEKADVESGEEEAVGGQALEAEAHGGWEPKLPEGLGCGMEDGEASIAEDEELQGGPGAEAGTVKSLGESEARETKEREVETSGLWETDRTFKGGWSPEEVALSLQESEHTQDSSLARETEGDEVVPDVKDAGTEEEPEWPAGTTWEGEFGRGWEAEGREEAERGAELVEATAGKGHGAQEFGLEDSAEEEEVTGRGGQAEALAAGEEERAERDATVAGGGSGMDSITSGAQVARAEGAVAIVEVEGPLGERTLLEAEADGRQAGEQREDGEGQCGDHGPEGGAQRLLDPEDTLTGGQRPEAQETEPEGLEDVHSLEGQLTGQAPAEALLEPSETAQAPGSTRGDPPSSWCEALLPGTRLDVSVPRSRALLSRSSSQRRSRPSFRRTPVPGRQDSPGSPPEEKLPAPEQTPLQLEEAPEPSPPRPEGTPVPTRRRPLGQGFGLAHPGMMQELQARLGRPSPSD